MTATLPLRAFLLLAVPAFAFASTQRGNTLYHSDEGLVCSDCHRQFNSSQDSALNSSSGSSSAGSSQTAALKKPNVTDLCLSCHSEGHNTAATADLPDLQPGNWTAPIVMTATGKTPPGIAMPAGDFYWSNLDPAKGHNPSYPRNSSAPTSASIQGDSVLGNRPPGGFLSDTQWSCLSCHGAHSRFDAGTSAWRQLKRRVNNVNVTGDVSRYAVETTSGDAVQDSGYEPLKSNSRGDMQDGSYLNMRKDGNPLEGADLFQPEGDANKNVYRGGFSSFCSACHGAFHGGDAESRFGGGSNGAAGNWTRHPSNMRMGESDRYGIAAYTASIGNAQGSNPNPSGYDWKYPLVKSDYDFTVQSSAPSQRTRSVFGDDRIMCLTCHKSHAAPFANMTRWDAKSHSFIGAGERDFTGELATGDNLAYGCGKCHQMGGTDAYIKAF